jgi:molecular chaperone GrpE
MPRKKKAPPKSRDIIKDAGTEEEDIQAVKVKVTDERKEDGTDTETDAPETEGEGADLTPDEEIAKLIQEKQEQYERLLRVQADFDNYRKRVQKERADLLRYGSENALREVLPIIDNIELAVDAAKSHDNSDSHLREGIEMILSQFFTTLEKLGVKPIETVEHPFDPNKHDALLRVYAPEAEEDAVVSEVRKGYYLHDKVLRAAQVTVGTREQEQSSEQTSEGTGEKVEESEDAK